MYVCIYLHSFSSVQIFSKPLSQLQLTQNNAIITTLHLTCIHAYIHMYNASFTYSPAFNLSFTRLLIGSTTSVIISIHNNNTHRYIYEHPHFHWPNSTCLCSAFTNTNTSTHSFEFTKFLIDAKSMQHSSLQIFIDYRLTTVYDE